MRWLGRFALERPTVRIEDLREGAVAFAALAANPDGARRALMELCGRHGLEPVRQPAQPRAEGGVGAADAVVGHDDRSRAVRAADADRHVRRLRVLRHVGDRLGDDVVRRRLDRAASRSSGISVISTGTGARANSP